MNVPKGFIEMNFKGGRILVKKSKMNWWIEVLQNNGYKIMKKI